MKKSVMVAIVFALLLCLNGSAVAGLYVLRPAAQDLFTNNFDGASPVVYENHAVDIRNTASSLVLENDFNAFTAGRSYGLIYDSDYLLSYGGTKLTPVVVAVPEAGTLGFMILGLGLLCCGRYIRRRHK